MSEQQRNTGWHVADAHPCFWDDEDGHLICAMCGRGDLKCRNGITPRHKGDPIGWPDSLDLHIDTIHSLKDQPLPELSDTPRQVTVKRVGVHAPLPEGHANVGAYISQGWCGVPCDICDATDDVYLRSFINKPMTKIKWVDTGVTHPDPDWVLMPVCEGCGAGPLVRGENGCGTCTDQPLPESEG